MSHTRTPWKAINIGEMPRAEVNAITEPTVCVCGDYLIVVDGSRGYDNHEEDSNDAEFIVKAVNAHDELVAALKECRRHVSENLKRMYGHDEFGEIRRLDAALAKVGETL